MSEEFGPQVDTVQLVQQLIERIADLELQVAMLRSLVPGTSDFEEKKEEGKEGGYI